MHEKKNSSRCGETPLLFLSTNMTSIKSAANQQFHIPLIVLKLFFFSKFLGASSSEDGVEVPQFTIYIASTPGQYTVSITGTGSRLSACLLIKLLSSNLLFILSVNNPTHMYLSDLRVHFKVEVYFRVTCSRMGEY